MLGSFAQTATAGCPPLRAEQRSPMPPACYLLFAACMCFEQTLSASPTEPRVDESGEPQLRAGTGCSTPARGIGLSSTPAAPSPVGRQCPHRDGRRMVLVAGPACLPVRVLTVRGPGPDGLGAFAYGCVRPAQPPTSRGSGFVVTAVAAPPSRMRNGGHQDGDPCALLTSCTSHSLSCPLQRLQALAVLLARSFCGSTGVVSL